MIDRKIFVTTSVLFSSTAMGMASALVMTVPLAAMIAVMRNAWPTSGSDGTLA